jgi:hypothetical protein
VGRSRLFNAALVAALTVICGAFALAPQDQPRLAGEAGLYVWQRRDSVIVQWITDQPVPGILRASANGQIVYEVETPARYSHRAAFRAKNNVLSLAYGSRDAGSAQYTTVIDREQPKTSPIQPATDSLFVIADTHGEYETVVKLLRSSGLINQDLQWAGGSKQLVLLGDVVDRGPEVTRLLWLYYRLEREAKSQGGRLHVLLGNHEIMVMLDDLRYVHPQEKKLAELHQVRYPRLFDPRASILGRWLASKPAIIRIDRILFTHGGISSDYLEYTPQSHADSLRGLMGRDLFYAHADSTVNVRVDSATLARFESFFWGERSVFWYRGYVESDTLASELDKVLARFDADIHIVGHTPQPTAHAKYNGRLIAAHPKTPGIEMLLLTRRPKGYDVQRIALDGTRTPLPDFPQ